MVRIRTIRIFRSWLLRLLGAPTPPSGNCSCCSWVPARSLCRGCGLRSAAPSGRGYSLRDEGVPAPCSSRLPFRNFRASSATGGQAQSAVPPPSVSIRVHPWFARRFSAVRLPHSRQRPIHRRGHGFSAAPRVRYRNCRGRSRPRALDALARGSVTETQKVRTGP